MSLINAPIKSGDEIIAAAQRLAASGKRKMVAIAAAQDADVIEAIASAEADGILDATLFGDKVIIEKMASDGRIDITRLDIVDEKDVNRATVAAVKMAADGKADIVMKGYCSTSTLLKTVLSKDFNLRTKNTLSHIAVMGIPGYHKLLGMTDGGMVVKADHEQKLQMLENAVLVARALGINPIKVAISDFDKENGRVFIEKAKKLNLKDVIIDGPMTIDQATSMEIAKRRNLGGVVAGDADIFIMNSIEECNIVAKALIFYSSALFAGVIVGAKIPISLVSRTDDAMNKKASVSLACLIAESYKQSGVEV
jgi:phosphate butyryltransferase